MVEREPHRESKEYDLVRLYLDDVEEIERALNRIPPREGGYSSQSVSNGKWRGETIAELIDQGDTGPFNNFKVERHVHGLISLEVGENRTRLYVSDHNDLDLRDAFQTIDNVLRRSQLGPVRRFFVSGWGLMFFMVPGFFAFCIVLAQLFARRGPWYFDVSLGALALACGVALEYAFRTDQHRNGLVYFIKRPENVGYVQRNRDIVVGGFFAVVGIAAPPIIEAFIKKK